MDVRSLAGNEASAAHYAERAAPWLVRALGRRQARVGIPDLA
jgi:hypothetical protein